MTDTPKPRTPLPWTEEALRSTADRQNEEPCGYSCVEIHDDDLQHAVSCGNVLYDAGVTPEELLEIVNNFGEQWEQLKHVFTGPPA